MFLVICLTPRSSSILLLSLLCVTYKLCGAAEVGNTDGPAHLWSVRADCGLKPKHTLPWFFRGGSGWLHSRFHQLCRFFRWFVEVECEEFAPLVQMTPEHAFLTF